MSHKKRSSGSLKYFDSFRGENARTWVLKIVRNSRYSWIKNRPKIDSMTEDDEGNQPRARVRLRLLRQ